MLFSLAVTNDPSLERLPLSETAHPVVSGITSKVVKGSLWTFVGQVLPLVFSLGATPFLIRFLGAEGYGVLILVGLIPMYFSFADLGMGMASTKFAAEAFAAGDRQKEARIVRTAAAINLSVSLPVAAILILFSDSIIRAFNVPETLIGDGTLALKIAAATLVVNLLNGIVNTPQLTRLRMDLNTLVTTSFRIAGIVASPIVLYLGGGLSGAVLVLFIASLLTFAGHLVVSGHLLPPLFGLSVEPGSARRMLRFGGGLVAVGIASVLLANLEKGVLARAASVEMLAYYSVAFAVASMAMMFSTAMIQSLVPAFSQLLAAGRESELSDLFSRSILLNCFTLIPGSVMLLVVARPFFTIWAGEAFGDNSTVPFYILLAGLLVNIPAFVAYSYLVSLGKNALIAKLYWIELVPYILMVFVLTRQFGILGTAAAFSVRMAIDGAIFFILAKRESVVGLTIFRGGIRSFILPLLIYAPVIVLTVTRALDLPFVLAAYVAATAVFVLLGWKNLLITVEKEWLQDKLARFGAR